jgi:hypothetical protein
MSHRVYALNSFVLPAHEVDVGHAPKLGRCPYGKIFNPILPAHFVKVPIFDVLSVLRCLFAHGSLNVVHHFIWVIGYLLR